MLLELKIKNNKLSENYSNINKYTKIVLPKLHDYAKYFLLEKKLM